MVGDEEVFFTSRNERFRQIVNILGMVCNHCKNVFEETYRSAINLRVF